MSKSKAVAIAFTIALSPISANAADCSVFQKQLSDLQSKYKDIYDGYKSDGDNIKSEAGANFDVKVTWANTKIVFDTPTVTVKDQRIVLGLPQVTMKMQDIIFDTPSVTMVPTKIGQYPEITCDHAVIPSCTTKWSDIITNVPKTFMQRQDIKTLIPEFTFTDTSFVMGVPEFSMQRQEIIMGLPQFELKSVTIFAKKIQAEGENLTAKVNTTKSQQMKEASTNTNQLFVCLREDLNVQKAKASVMFEDGISKLTASIAFMKQIGADPSKVTDSSGKSINMNDQLADLISKREAAFQQFDAGMKKLEDTEQATVKQIAST
jgi:hypothetical protein